MKVIIRTEWPDVVRSCMFMMEFGSYVSILTDKNFLVLDFTEDSYYRDIAAWLGHALACGLILRGEIER